MIEKELLGRGVIGKQAFGDGQGLCFIIGLFADRPVGATLVSRIEDDIAASFVIKLGEVLAMRIVNDRRLATFLDLVEDRADEC